MKPAYLYRRERTNRQRREALVKLMKRYRLTTQFVGDYLDVHRVTVSKWRTGTHPMPEALMRYLELYQR